MIEAGKEVKVYSDNKDLEGDLQTVKLNKKARSANHYSLQWRNGDNWLIFPCYIISLKSRGMLP